MNTTLFFEHFKPLFYACKYKYKKKTPQGGHKDLLAVSAPLPPLSLNDHIRALASNPGYFHLNDEAYPSSSHWPTLTPIILRSYLVFIVCIDLVSLSWPAPKQCFTPKWLVNCCASMHFGENQRALGSTGISPITTTHSNNYSLFSFSMRSFASHQSTIISKLNKSFLLGSLTFTFRFLVNIFLLFSLFVSFF